MFSANSSQVSEDRLYVEDVFSTYLYSGTSGAQSINNGIDTLNKGGLVWMKNRGSALSHILIDTAQGCTFAGGKNLISNSTSAAGTIAANTFKFDSTGFSFGSAASGGAINASGNNYVSWSFREAPKFFDVLTYTGNGASNRAISHSLASSVGMIIIKATGATDSWWVWHRSFSTNEYIFLNQTAAKASGADTFPTTPTTTDFYVGANGANVNAQPYVAYLFAHDTTSDGVIQCGSATCSGGVATINLGWEPQWILAKQTNTTGDWRLIDNMRGWTNNSGGNQTGLQANTSAAEASYGWGDTLSPTGCNLYGGSTDTFIYIAIRRGPMRTPTSGTSVFSPVANSISPNTPYTTGFPVDWILTRKRASDSTYVGSRLTGGGTYLTTNATTAETAVTSWYFDKDTGTMASNIYTSAQSYIYWNFRRAPSFFDVVCYTGNATNNRAINHNLGAVPELMIIKRRSSSGTGWATYSAPTGVGKVLILNTTDAAQSIPSFYDTAPTATTFTIEANGWTNTSGETYVAYLFASCPGVSKVFSFTGNGSSQTINCGFSSGARFVMIKRTDSTGDWWVWDTARGLVSGNDPALRLNSTAAETTGIDSIDPDSSGFIVNQDATTNINVNGASYVGIAIS